MRFFSFFLPFRRSFLLRIQIGLSGWLVGWLAGLVNLAKGVVAEDRAVIKS